MVQKPVDIFLLNLWKQETQYFDGRMRKQSRHSKTKQEYRDCCFVTNKKI